MDKTLLIKICRLVSLRSIGVLMQLVVQVLVARVAGPTGVGVLQLCQTVTCVGGELIAQGLPTQLLKNVATYDEITTAYQQYLHSIRRVVLLWLVGGGLLLLSHLLFAKLIGISGLHQAAIYWAVLCFALLRLSAEVLKALGLIEQGILFENSVIPLLFIILLSAVLYGTVPVGEDSIANLLVLASALFITITSMLAVARCLVFLNKAIFATNCNSSHSHIGKSKETKFFWLTSIFSIGFLNLPFLLMPLFGSMAEVGFFALAFKLINPISTILIMLGAFYSPRFAQVIHRSEQGAMQLLWQSQWVSVALYGPVILPLLIFPETILAFFGTEFVAAKPYLYLLIAAQLVNAATGLAGTLLNMSGRGKHECYGTLAAVVLACVCGISAGTLWGVYGVAVGYAVAVVFKNLWSYGFAIKLLAPSSRQYSLAVKGVNP